MSQHVVLSLGNGDLSSGFPTVTVHLWKDSKPYPMKFTGSLPPAPEISQLYRSWQALYTALHYRLGWQSRIQIDQADVTNVSQVEFGDLCQQLSHQMNHWLNSDLFRSIDQPLRTQLNAFDEIRFLIETHDRLLQRLPWHLWNFFEHYPHAEVGFSPLSYQPPLQSNFSSTSGVVRILAILGNSQGIDLEKDQECLKHLPDVNIHFLIEPTFPELNTYLWQSWDILFFAGHSSSQVEGVIQLSQTDNLSLNQLRYGLRGAIDRGLKLAIFNSCDGLGLAAQLADLQIPQVIVMREPVPNLVAQEFLQYFLTAYSGGQSLYAAVREARERLQGLEQEYLCATWLPAICQNPTIAPPSWEELKGDERSEGGKKDREGKKTKKGLLLRRRKQCRSRHLLVRGIASGLLVAMAVIGVRWVGGLQAWELQAFDQLIQWRPDEGPDTRLLVITIDEQDFKLPQQQQRRGSLSDLALAKLLQKLETYQPRVIGLDILRDFPVDPQQPELARRMRESDRLVVVCDAPRSDYPGVAPPPEVPKERQGFSDFVRDSDKILRRHLIGMEVSPGATCATQFAFNSQLAFRYLEAEGLPFTFNQDRQLQIGNAVFQRLRSHMSGYQQIDDWGYQILLNYRTYRRSPSEIAVTISLTDALQGALKPKDVKDRIVLIGSIAPSSGDYHPTPYKTSGGFNQEIPGVIMQAQMVSQLVSAVKDGRPLLRTWPGWADVMWIGGWAIVGALLTLRQRSLFLGLAICIAVGAIVLFSYILLLQAVWIPLIPALLGLLLSTSVTLYIVSRTHPSNSVR